MEKTGVIKTKRVSSINILVMVLLTMLIIFSIYFAILVFTRPPIFNIFGETGAYLPSSITASIVISAGVSFILSIILLVPEIPVREIKKTEEKGSVLVVGSPQPFIRPEFSRQVPFQTLSSPATSIGAVTVLPGI